MTITLDELFSPRKQKKTITKQQREINFFFISLIRSRSKFFSISIINFSSYCFSHTKILFPFFFVVVTKKHIARAPVEHEQECHRHHHLVEEKRKRQTTFALFETSFRQLKRKQKKELNFYLPNNN